jgi:hypothetical protein
MTCRDLERWLDDGGAPERYVEAMAHARICAHCTATLRGMDELEDLLARPASRAPEAFTERVMARVALTPQAPAGIPVMELLPFFQTVPWWVRIAIDPAALLALLLASVLAWRGDALFALASGGAATLAAWLGQALAAPLPSPDPGAVGAVLIHPYVLPALAIGLAPLVFMASQAIYSWSAERVARVR